MSDYLLRMPDIHQYSGKYSKNENCGYNPIAESIDFAQGNYGAAKVSALAKNICELAVHLKDNVGLKEGTIVTLGEIANKCKQFGNGLLVLKSFASGKEFFLSPILGAFQERDCNKSIEKKIALIKNSADFFTDINLITKLALGFFNLFEIGKQINPLCDIGANLGQVVYQLASLKGHLSKLELHQAIADRIKGFTAFRLSKITSENISLSYLNISKSMITASLKAMKVAQLIFNVALLSEFSFLLLSTALIVMTIGGHLYEKSLTYQKSQA